MFILRCFTFKCIISLRYFDTRFFLHIEFKSARTDIHRPLSSTVCFIANFLPVPSFIFNILHTIIN